MAKKIKIKKPEAEVDPKVKELEEAKAAAGIQDEFQAKGFELVEWIHDHQPIVLSFIGLIVLGGVFLGVSSVVRHSRNESASVAYAKAVDAYEAPVGDAPAAKPA